uniref:Uncharacterized protein n=1 Tax=Lactuca sativa TaxID=4236 RepID=A0A9R1UFQ0_LACSA|nr:hypothetical protein LSAT_V11C900470970 [Lactuca sativa]
MKTNPFEVLIKSFSFKIFSATLLRMSFDKWTISRIMLNQLIAKFTQPHLFVIHLILIKKNIHYIEIYIINYFKSSTTYSESFYLKILNLMR